MSLTLHNLAEKKGTRIEGSGRSQDPLASLLNMVRMQSVFYTHSELSAPWGFELPPIAESLMFHLIVEGSCFVNIAGEQIQLEKGDYLMLPHGRGHKMYDQPGSACPGFFDLPVQSLSEHFETLAYGGSGPKTTLLCGAVSLNNPVAGRLLAMMPSMIKISAHSDDMTQHLQQLFLMLADETIHENVGGEVVITRLADILVILAIRAWLASVKEQDHGWLGAMADAGLRKAILAIHQFPDQAWTVESLAAEAGMSRTSFSEKFKKMLGETPLSYLTKWRMDLAKDKLLFTEESVLSIALSLGYQSEAAFSRAYKKISGRAPSHTRKQLSS